MSGALDLSTWPMWGNGLVVVATIGLIALGAHWLVESASRLAARLGISELVIGLTVVALGTSAPEFAVTVLAALREHGDISVSNIVGSNIFNLGFILGGCALVRAIPMQARLLKRDGAVLGATTLLLLALVGSDLKLGHLDGVLLFGLLLIYLIMLFRQRGEGLEEVEHIDLEASSLAKDSVLVLLSLGAILLGSHFLVDSAVAIARGFGVSEWASASRWWRPAPRRRSWPSAWPGSSRGATPSARATSSAATSSIYWECWAWRACCIR